MTVGTVIGKMLASACSLFCLHSSFFSAMMEAPVEFPSFFIYSSLAVAIDRIVRKVKIKPTMICHTVFLDWLMFREHSES